MSRPKGTKQYGEMIIEQVKQMREEGKTYREIAEFYNLINSEAVRDLLRRDRRKQNKIVAGIMPKMCGRPSKAYLSIEQKKDQEIKQLKMENELLRDFLQIAGRK